MLLCRLCGADKTDSSGQQKAAARGGPDEALHSGEIAALPSALGEGEAAGLQAEDMESSRPPLGREKRKAAARCGLEKAPGSGEIAAPRSAL